MDIYHKNDLDAIHKSSNKSKITPKNITHYKSQ